MSIKKVSASGRTHYQLKISNEPAATDEAIYRPVCLKQHEEQSGLVLSLTGRTSINYIVYTFILVT